MNTDSADRIRLVAFVCFIVGAALGLWLAQHAWHNVPGIGISRWRRVPGTGSLILAAICILSMGTLGAALAGFRLLPKEAADEAK